MRTSNFIKRVEELGYKVEKSQNINHTLTHILIHVSEHRTPIYVGTNQKNKINTDNLIVPDELFDLCVEYVRTPIEERKRNKTSDFRHLVISAGDYTYGRTNEESLEIYKFSNHISRMLLGYEICGNNTCPCQSRNRAKEYLKKEVIVDFVKFTDYYYGVDYVNELIKMGLWHV